MKIILQLHVHYVLCMVENWFLPWTTLQTIRFFYLYSNWDLWECCRFSFCLYFPTFLCSYIIAKASASKHYLLSSWCSIIFMICFLTSRYLHLHFLHIYFISISIIIKLLFYLNKSQEYAAKNWNTNNNLISFEYMPQLRL